MASHQLEIESDLVISDDQGTISARGDQNRLILSCSDFETFERLMRPLVQALPNYFDLAAAIKSASFVTVQIQIEIGDRTILIAGHDAKAFWQSLLRAPQVRFPDATWKEILKLYRMTRD